jgi:CheY-like chemotaxis protein
MYLKNFTVLYVEDSKVLQAYMRDLLQDLVKEIYIANDGKEGITMVSKHKPDIIVSDINMPDIDGLQMSKIIKNLMIPLLFY